MTLNVRLCCLFVLNTRLCCWFTLYNMYENGNCVAFAYVLEFMCIDQLTYFIN